MFYRVPSSHSPRVLPFSFFPIAFSYVFSLSDCFSFSHDNQDSETKVPCFNFSSRVVTLAGGRSESRSPPCRSTDPRWRRSQAMPGGIGNPYQHAEHAWMVRFLACRSSAPAPLVCVCACVCMYVCICVCMCVCVRVFMSEI